MSITVHYKEKTKKSHKHQPKQQLKKLMLIIMELILEKKKQVK